MSTERRDRRLSHGLADRTWTAVDGGSLLLLPLGSTEQHGPHLPLDTDAAIATAIAVRGADRLAEARRVLVAPTLPFGASGEHAGFAGTISIGTDALALVLVEAVRSLGPEIEATVFVNGHGGNHEAVTRAVETMRHEGRHVLAWSPRLAGSDAHAGRTETSLMLAIDPSRVQLDVAAPGATEPLSTLMDQLRAGGVRSVSANGVLGDPTGASADEGHQLLDEMVSQLVSATEAAFGNETPTTN